MQTLLVKPYVLAVLEGNLNSGQKKKTAAQKRKDYESPEEKEIHLLISENTEEEMEKIKEEQLVLEADFE